MFNIHDNLKGDYWLINNYDIEKIKIVETVTEYMTNDTDLIRIRYMKYFDRFDTSPFIHNAEITSSTLSLVLYDNVENAKVMLAKMILKHDLVELVDTDYDVWTDIYDDDLQFDKLTTKHFIDDIQEIKPEAFI